MITYGMSARTLAERMDLPFEEANKIIEDFYENFDGVRKFTEESQAMLREKGYITDIFGRRRHIKDGMLPQYTIETSAGFEFNPLLNSVQHEDNKTKALIDSYRNKLKNVKWKKDKDAIYAEAAKYGLKITDNGGFINRALRQCLNARIQGTAASMTKLAMVKIHNDKELADLGFKLLVTVHDEVFGSAPLVNAEAAGNRLCQVMVEAANERCSYTPWSVDPYCVTAWYSDEASGEILKDFKKGKSEEELCAKYSMFSKTAIHKIINGNFNPSLDSLK